jgi:hypothetical protein
MILAVIGITAAVTYIAYEVTKNVKESRYVNEHGPAKIVKKNVDGIDYYVIYEYIAWHWVMLSKFTDLEGATQMKNHINGNHNKRLELNKLNDKLLTAKGEIIE